MPIQHCQNKFQNGEEHHDGSCIVQQIQSEGVLQLRFPASVAELGRSCSPSAAPELLTTCEMAHVDGRLKKNGQGLYVWHQYCHGAN